MSSLVGIVHRIFPGLHTTVTPGEGQGDVTVGVNTSGLDTRYGFAHWDAIVDAAGGGTHTDIEAAIDAGAKSIFVTDGTYTLSESIDVDVAGIEIQGETQLGTIIDGDNGAFNMFEVTEDDFKIRNLTIKNVTSKNAIRFNAQNLDALIEDILFTNVDTAVVEDADILTIHINRCIIDDTYPSVATGINRLFFKGGGGFTKNWITNCVITVGDVANGASGDVGIKIGDIAGGGENIITDCFITVNTSGTGVLNKLDKVPTKISGCRFNHGDSTTAVELQTASNISDCHFFADGDDVEVGQAIKISSSGSNISGNIIFGGGEHGIVIEEDLNRIIGNRIFGAFQDGIFLDTANADNNIITANLITQNLRNGVNISAATQSGNIITSNIFKSNATNIADSGTDTEIANNVEA